jgi:hypothetical protein
LEHQRKVQEAIKAKARVPDEMEMKAIKTMGAMEEGDAVFGAGAEVNLDSQVCIICLLGIPWIPSRLWGISYVSTFHYSVYVLD